MSPVLVQCLKRAHIISLPFAKRGFIMSIGYWLEDLCDDLGLGGVWRSATRRYRERQLRQPRPGWTASNSIPAQVCILESRVLLSASIPADIDQMVQSSEHPEAWYAALDVILPAIEQD